MTRRREDALAASVLALWPFAALCRAFAPGVVLAPVDLLRGVAPFAAPGAPPPANPLLFDATFIFHPWQLYAGAEMAAGRFPLWNPHAFAGAPFFANPQSALLFPLTLLTAALPAAAALTLTSLLKLSIAGLAAYWFLRTLAATPRAALLGALVYEGSAVLGVWLEWSYANGIAVLPLLFGAVERLRTRPGLRPVAWLALAVALLLLAGYPQLAALGIALAALWGIARGPGAARRPAFLGRLTLGLALGIALAAVQVLPFLEYARESSVLFYRRQWTPIVAPPARSAIALLMPWYYGGPGSGAFWGYSNFNELAASVGLVPWLLAPVAAVLGWRRGGTPFFLALAAFALAGFYRLPLVGDALANVPPFTWIASQRVLPFLPLALAALTATAWDALPEAAARRRAVSAAVVLAAALGLISLAYLSIVDDAAWLTRHAVEPSIAIQLGGFLALLTLAASLVLRAHGLGSSAWEGRAAWLVFAALAFVQLASTAPLTIAHRAVSPASLLYPWTPALRHLASATAADAGRVDLGFKNLGALYGLRAVAGYDGMTPRLVEEVASPAADLGLFGNSALSVTTGAWSPVFDLLALRRVLTAPGAPPPAPHFGLEYDGPDARVYRNERALPRAFVVSRARCAGASDLAAMHAGGVDFRREVLLAECDRPVAEGGAPSSRASARIARDDPERVVVEVDAPGDGWLVLTDTWFPGWRVTVDGAARPLLRANHAFRAVAVAGGRHTVEFTYAPASFRLGGALSLIALTAIVACIASGSAAPSRWVIVAGIVVFAAVAVVVALSPAGRPGWSHALPDPLPSPPRTLRLSSTTLVAGERASLRLEADSRAVAGGPVDVYVARIPGGPPAVTLLGPDGTWGSRLVPLAAGVTAASPPIEVAWPEQGPPGWITLVVVTARTSEPPTRREHWAAQASLTTVRIRSAPAVPGDLPGLLVPLGGGVVAAAILVVLAYRQTRKSPAGD